VVSFSKIFDSCGLAPHSHLEPHGKVPVSGNGCSFPDNAPSRACAGEHLEKTFIDPENKGVRKFDPDNKGLSVVILKTKGLATKQ
jgi:hypothetical protein